MATFLTTAEVFAPYTWVELDSNWGRTKAVLPNSEVDAYIASQTRFEDTWLSDLDPMPVGWTPETGYGNVPANDWELRIAYYDQQDAEGLGVS